MPQEYQRLLANPFLAVAALIYWIAALRRVLMWHDLVGSFIVAAGFAVVVALLHYHCLDCGATGWVQSAWRHCCPAVTARAQSGIVRRPPRLSVKNQMIAWIYLLVVAFAVWVIFFASPQ